MGGVQDQLWQRRITVKQFCQTVQPHIEILIIKVSQYDLSSIVILYVLVIFIVIFIMNSL